MVEEAKEKCSAQGWRPLEPEHDVFLASLEVYAAELRISILQGIGNNRRVAIRFCKDFDPSCVVTVKCRQKLKG